MLTRVKQIVAALRDARPRNGPPEPASAGARLDAVNQDFHDRYAEAREAALGDGAVFVAVADELVLFRRGERTAWSFSPRAFHVIKSVSHAPIALWALCQRSQPVDQARLVRTRELLDAAADDVSSAELDDAVRGTLHAVLDASRALIDQLSKTGPDPARLDAFAAALGPSLLRLVHEATRLQLDALHRHTEYALSQLSPAERNDLHVVVTGDHQARVRSLAMQYFRKRFAEPADAEERVTYAEGVSDEQAALQLVGIQRLDRKLARAFFGDERRLQRDILGDAARELLRSR